MGRPIPTRWFSLMGDYFKSLNQAGTVAAGVTLAITAAF